MSLQVTRDGHVAILEMHRPPANFFDRQLLESIAEEGHAAHRDGARAILLCSQGKHFCAGADFSSGGVGEDRVADTRRVYEAARGIFDIPVPVVAAVQGAAVGGGLGLACAADFRVAGPGSRFHANFASLGFHQGFGISVSLPRIVGAQAASRLLLAARRVSGPEAREMGLVDSLVDDDADIREEALAWARRLAAQAPLAVAAIRSTLRAGLSEAVGEVLEHEITQQARLWATEDCVEGLAATAERREPVFQGR